jgi:hypothetical protein
LLDGNEDLFLFLFLAKMKRIHCKEKQDIKPLEGEERHHVLETLIDDASLGSIITPLNKATYFDTNNLVPTQLLSNF